MPVSCQLRLLLAGQERSAVSPRRPARESGVSLSGIIALQTGRSQRVDYATLDRLLTYFSRSLHVSMDDLLVWEPAPAGEAPAGNRRVARDPRGTARDACAILASQRRHRSLIPPTHPCPTIVPSTMVGDRDPTTRRGDDD